MGGPASLWGPTGSWSLGGSGQFCSLLGGPRLWPLNSVPRTALPGLGAALPWGGGIGKSTVRPLHFLFGPEMRYVLS